MTFDVRKGNKPSNYYNFHYYPLCDFAEGNGVLNNFGVSCGTTQHMQYDVRPIDFSKSAKDHDPNYVIYPGHKAVITNIK